MNNLLDTIKSGFQDEPGGDHDSSSDEEDDPIDLEAAKKHKKTKKHPHPALAEQAPIDYMGHFYREMDNVRTTINEIGQATQAIKTLQEQALSATTAQQEETLSRKLQPILNASTQRAKHTQQLLTLLQEETTRLQEERETLSDSDLRVRHNLGTTITRKFVDEMKLYQSAQQEYKNAIQSKAKRQIIAIQPDATEEQVEQVMRAEGGREALMKQVVLNNQTVHTEIQSTFDKVAGKYQDVIKLEASVAELHQMFLDFALLTEQQGELLDSIEFSLSHANDHVEYANEETVKAMEYQSAVRKKQCWIIGIVSGVMLVLAFVIFG